MRQRTFLSVTRHAAVDQFGIALRDVERSESESLGDTRTKALNENVGLLTEFEDQRSTGVTLEIYGNRRTRSIEQIPRRLRVGVHVATFNAQDVGAEVGHQHARVGAG